MDKSLGVNIARDLVGKAVPAPGSSQMIGEITDAMIQPAEGRLLGLALRARDGSERVIPARGLAVCSKSVSIIWGGAMFETGEGGPSNGGVRALRELRGADVVTDNGRLLGRVCEVQLSPVDGRVFYRVAEAGLLHRLFGDGLLIEGSAANSFSRAGSRLIVREPAPACEVGGGLRTARGAIAGGWWKAGEGVHAFLCRHGLVIWLVILIALLLLLLWA